MAMPYNHDETTTIRPHRCFASHRFATALENLRLAAGLAFSSIEFYHSAYSNALTSSGTRYVVQRVH